jgi:hypothetical protein
MSSYGISTKLILDIVLESSEMIGFRILRQLVHVIVKTVKCILEVKLVRCQSLTVTVINQTDIIAQLCFDVTIFT